MSTVSVTFADLVKINQSQEEVIQMGKIIKTPISSRSFKFSKKKKKM